MFRKIALNSVALCTQGTSRIFHSVCKIQLSEPPHKTRIFDVRQEVFETDPILFGVLDSLSFVSVGELVL